MNQHIETLQQTLEESLQKIHRENTAPLSIALAAVKLLQEGMESLKQLVLTHSFSSPESEIFFFKTTKPLLLSKLILYHKMLQIELRRPQGSEKLTRKFLQLELEKIENYYEVHRDFFNYYRTGCTYLDHKYFVRRGFDLSSFPGSFYFDTDHRFSTSHDLVISRLLANESLIEYIQKALQGLNAPVVTTTTNNAVAATLQWTDSKASLIELIYGLHSQSALENGKADIKAIASCFEKVFNIELGDYYRAFLELRNRKTGRTKFLDSMRERLQERMEEYD